MFIQTEPTPNPRTLKFIPGQIVLDSGTATFVDEESAKASPLAEALFAIAEVEGVFLGHDFITVSRSESAEWDVLKPTILTTIMEHFIAGKPMLHPSDGSSAVVESNTASEEDDPIVRQIKELIDTRVRPAVAEDGGDIIYRSFQDGVVALELRGACSGCPSSTLTLKEGIENMLRYYVPEVKTVEAVSGAMP